MRGWLFIAVLVAGCTKEASSARDGVIEAWKQDGLSPSAFAAATTQVGTDCAAGTVAKLDVLVCAFASEQDAKAAEGGGLAWIGDATGVSRARGSTLTVVADRRNADPNGRTINRLVAPHVK
jgi:hypothetical protein